MDLQELNKQFGVAENITFVAGKNGLTRVDLTLDGASASVYLLGATVTSFQDSPGKDIIWLSEKANFAPGKAIRGGIPVCWPQFGPGALVQHGFARTSEFSVHRTNKNANGVSVTLRLTHSAQTLELWPHKFEFDITIGLLAPEAQHSPSLHMQLAVFNRSEEEFNFTCAFHTYFTVPDVTQVAITPLQQHTYFDKLTISDSTQESPVVSIVGETDRVYHKMPSRIEISSKEKSQSIISLAQENFSDVVIWNPGEAKASAMADLSSWKDFVCVESAVVQHPATVPAGAVWTASHTISRLVQSSL